MNVLALILIAIAKILHLIFTLYMFLIGIAAILSWVNPDPNNPIVRTVRQLTEPVLWKIRKRFPTRWLQGSIDWTPMVLLFILILLDTVVVQLLYDWALKIKGGF